MTSNPIINPSKDQLIEDMLGLAHESNFSLTLEETLKEVLQCKPMSPYLYLHKKTYSICINVSYRSLKSKFDNSKISQYLCEVAMYLSTINPLTFAKQTITNKLMCLCIDKFNHLKVKKFQTHQFINFLLIDLGEKQKQEFIRTIDEEKMENDNLSVMVFAKVMYWTVVYLWAIKQINELMSKLKVCIGASSSSDGLINVEIINNYLAGVEEEDSMLKVLLNFTEINQGDSVQVKVIERIFQLFDGEGYVDANNK